jgi:hypothetical protein
MNGSSPNQMAEQEDSERLRRLEKVYAATTRGELHELCPMGARL